MRRCFSRRQLRLRRATRCAARARGASFLGLSRRHPLARGGGGGGAAPKRLQWWCPNLTEAECLALAARLRALADLARDSSDFVRDVSEGRDTDIAGVAAASGFGAVVTGGVAAPPPPPPAGIAPSALPEHSDGLLGLVLLKTASRAAEAASLMAAAASPAYGLLCLLKATPAAAGVAGRAWSALIAPAAGGGATLAAALFAPLLAALRSPATPLALAATARLSTRLREGAGAFFSEATQYVLEAQTLASRAAAPGAPAAERADAVSHSYRAAALAAAAASCDETLALWPQTKVVVATLVDAHAPLPAALLLLAAAHAAAGGGDRVRRLPADASLNAVSAAAAAAATSTPSMHSPTPRALAPLAHAPSAATTLRREAYLLILSLLEGVWLGHVGGSGGGGGASASGSGGGGGSALAPLRLAAALSPLPRGVVGGADAALRSRASGRPVGGGDDEACVFGPPASAAARRDFEALLSDTLNSTDVFWHETLYAWLLQCGLSGVLTRVDTPYVRPYLADRATDRTLIYQYFLERGQHAGKWKWSGGSEAGSRVRAIRQGSEALNDPWRVKR